MKEIKRTVFNGQGKVVIEDTGELHQLESNDYKITIEEYLYITSLGSSFP